MTKSQHTPTGDNPQNQNNAMSDDPADGHRLTDKPEAIRPTAAEQPPEGDPQRQPTPEEFGARGMGAAAKE